MVVAYVLALIVGAKFKNTQKAFHLKLVYFEKVPGLQSQSISALHQHISRIKTQFSSETSCLQNILSFLCAVFLHYDYIEVREFAQA